MRICLAASTLLVAFTIGCTDKPEQGLTSPQRTLAPRLTALAPCDGGIATTARNQANRLFAGNDLIHALQFWDAIEAECTGNFANAPNVMLSYVRFTLGLFDSARVLTPAAGTAADSLVSHWNPAFAYVGYDPPNLGADVLGPEGAVGVVPANVIADQEIRAANAALTMRPQIAGGDPRGHLFAIAPIPGGCLGGINLRQTGPCFEFSSFPKADPAFNPGVKVGVCQPVNEDDQLSGRRPALGHLTGGGSVEIPQQAAYPTFCTHLDDPLPTFTWSSGFSGAAKRVAWMARRVLAPQPLYAVHGGLGGVGTELSPFGGVDLMVFEEGLHGEALGGMPGSPEAGTWTSAITKPGKIFTQFGMGSYRDTIIVINQAGGNCGVRCGGILLQANLFDAGTSGATSGRYDVSWVSVQEKNTVKEAPFILRGTAGEIARLEYRTKSGRQELFYNGVLVGNWVRQVPQRFVIRVDLNTKKTSLWFGPLSATPAPASPAIPFINAGANLTQLAADFTGQDGGITGWAEISLQRIPDA